MTQQAEKTEVELSETEKIAVVLFYTYQKESGEVYDSWAWLTQKNPNEVVIAIWRWMKLEPHIKDAWLAVAECAITTFGAAASKRAEK